jgi:protein-tyrosine phosphatase
MKILMVCLGNICRSPLAHGIMEHMVQQNDLNWEIDSAGTGGWHVGQPPDRRSIGIAKKYGLDISLQTCRKFDVIDFEKFDQILVMDHTNLQDVRAMARNEAEQNKIRLFMKDTIVPDPYYNDDQFDPVYQMIEKRCKEFLHEYTSGI